ncbi:hypothetical protein DJ564_21915 [Pseudomonas sp. 31-12]|nr:hypothetical protein DJ564_21915 [Pseudomonas sp. 31-12]
MNTKKKNNFIVKQMLIFSVRVQVVARQQYRKAPESKGSEAFLWILEKQKADLSIQQIGLFSR